MTGSADEFLRAFRELTTMPESWLTWAERIVQRRLDEGILLRDPLPYRLHVLWQGIIALQEGKYLCDVLEGSLRQAVLAHSRNYRITVGEVFPAIPGWEDVLAAWERSIGRKVDEHDPVAYRLLASLSFYQLTELIGRNWKRPSLGSPSRTNLRDAGLRHLFTSAGRRRQGVDAFQQQMKAIRQQRNVIAHSKALVSPEDRERLYGLTTKWLVQLGVSVDTRILRYRESRPRFLHGIEVSTHRHG